MPAKRRRRWPGLSRSIGRLRCPGETTVTVRGNGRGGRNVEWLLSVGITPNGHPRIHALAGDTDGVDGQEEIAGALGPASSDKDIVRGLLMAGVDVFQLNFSHGSAVDHRARCRAVTWRR